jgi:thioredoxin 1
MNYTPSTQVIEEIKSPNRTLVVFSAEWCGPCKAMNPLLDKALEDGQRIFKINIDEDVDYSWENHIRSIPTFILYEDEKLLTRHVGVFNSVNELSQFISK